MNALRYLLFSVSTLLCSFFALAADDPSDLSSSYRKGPTWHESMLVSSEALRLERERSTATNRTSRSPAMRGGEAPVSLDLAVTGWRDLYLVVEDEGDYHHDVANWGDARLVDSAGNIIYLDSLEPISADQNWGTFRRDKKSAVGGPLQVADRVFSRGLGTHANSVIHYKLTNDFVSFHAEVGVDVSRGKEGLVRFVVSDKLDADFEEAEAQLWHQLARDFPDDLSRRQIRWEQRDQIWEKGWGSIRDLALRYAKATRHPLLAQEAAALAGNANDPQSLAAVRNLYCQSHATLEATSRLEKFNFAALRLAILDLQKVFSSKYPRAAEYTATLQQLENRWNALRKDSADPDAVVQLDLELQGLRSNALLANPLLDFEKLLLVRRSTRNLGLPANWQGNSSLPRSGFDNEIATMPLRPGGPITKVYRPENSSFVGDMDLHFDGDRLMFSAIGSHNRWQLFEIRTDGTGLRQLTPGDQVDVDNYDGCYLPDGRIIFCSSASMVGVPCVDGSDHVATLFQLQADGRSIRQLCFDQDHNWSPTLLNDGRILYQRWEYADTPHAHTRLLFRMNPDGTAQEEFYGSNSYWPNAMFFARPIPGHPTRVAAIVGGHHGAPRMGELVIFDPARGRQETQGAVQRIPGYGQKVEPIISDQLVDASWPKFLHPWPLNENYFLVSAKPTPESLWGIYLVDVFDNMLLLAESEGNALLEPTPLRKTTPPPVIPDRVDTNRTDAVVYLADIYQGDGLKGVPRGTVTALRIFAYHWAYQGMGGLLGTIGLDGPWDIRQMLGTVPVETDGSAYFKVPANTPISVQPLDHEGKAIQVMRSWFTAMPGENVSCVGCHERQNNTPSSGYSMALARRVPRDIIPWRGEPRGFSFKREVQPVLDKHCVACHDGDPSASEQIPDLRGSKYISDFRLVTPGRAERLGGRFSVAYANLHRYVRRPGIESDYHLLMPLEFHADTTELVQLLRKNHHGVRLDSEDWDRLITWLDLNAPYHGSWGEELQDPGSQRERRRELRKLYTGMDDADAEVIPSETNLPSPRPAPGKPRHAPLTKQGTSIIPPAGWPFDAAEATRRQSAAGLTKFSIPLQDDITLELVLIPPGDFIMGDADGATDEQPLTRVAIPKPFWMARTEVRNDQFRLFAPSHDSHVESKTAYQFGVHGYPLDAPDQPVVRVSWQQAIAFCEWLSARTGRRFHLPTEAQWEYACRAGTATPFHFGSRQSDFSQYANLADAKLIEFASDPYTVFTALKNPSLYEDYIPKETRFHDGALVTTRVGSYKPNAWGLHDMHGNAWEWTRSSFKAYPYNEQDGRNDLSTRDRKVVRGGSWRDRPFRAGSAYRLAYQPWQGVFNVGFRVVCEEPDPAPTRKTLSASLEPTSK